MTKGSKKSNIGRAVEGLYQFKTMRAVAAYGFSLLVLIVAIALSYTILHSSLTTQRAVAKTNAMVTEVQLSVINTSSIINDLKLQLKEDRPNRRILQLITRNAKASLTDLEQFQDDLEAMAPELAKTDVSEQVAWIVDSKKGSLNDKLGSYIHQMEIFVATDFADESDNTPQIPLEAAAARDGTIYVGYQDASAELEKLLETQARHIEWIHTALTALIIIVFLSVSFLVVAPLWRSLIREHKKLKDANANLFHIAYTDRETGLPNLDGLESRLNELVSFNDSSPCFYLLLIRINNLDELYNLIGSHQVEELLQSVSRRLQNWNSNDEQWCRSGEAEFSCVISHAAFEQADDWVQALHNSLISRLTVAGVIVRPEVSMAVSRIKKSEAFYANSLWEHQANARLASLSFEPLSCWLPEYNPDLKNKLEDQNNLINRISEGISAGEFEPFYQIKVDAKSGAPQAIEVLARWVLADGSVVSPDKFIPAAESSGLIVKLTYLLFDKVKEDISQWCAEGVDVGRVAINIASDVLHNDQLLGRLHNLHTSLPANCAGIDVEITENIAIGDNLAKTEKVLHLIRALGIHIAIDDFGTGYASLQTLIDMPVDVLKIDRSFVLPMTETGDGKEVVSAMIYLSNTLNKNCVVEGIETEWQWRMLAELGADELQGYYFHRPANSRDTLAELIKAADWKMTG